MRKKIIRLGSISICLALLCGCGVDFYAGRRPAARSDEQWVSEDPPMYFTWNEEAGGHWGEITTDGVTRKVLVLFDYGTGMIVAEDGESRFLEECELFRGNCKFGKDRVTVKVKRDQAGLFGEDLPTITFERQVKEDED